MELEPQSEQPAGKWIVADPATTPTFWVPGYFFAKGLQQTLHVPVGYIAAAKGNTPVEAWMSAQALGRAPYLKAFMERTRYAWLHFDELHEAYYQAYLQWQRQFGREDRKANPQVLKTEGVPPFRNAAASDPVDPQHYAAPEVDDAAWKVVTLPGMAADMGLPASGAVWFRKTVTLPAEMAGKDIQISSPGTECHRDVFQRAAGRL